MKLEGSQPLQTCCQPVVYGLCQQRKLEPELVIVDCSTKFLLDKKLKCVYNCIVQTADDNVVVFVQKIDDDIYEVNSVGENFVLTIMMKYDTETVQMIVNGKTHYIKTQANKHREQILEQKMNPNFDFDWMVEIKV